LCEKYDAKEGNQHKCSNALLDVPLNTLHHVTTDSRHKAIFIIDAVIIYDKSIAAVT
jgi:hypothetical protein